MNVAPFTYRFLSEFEEAWDEAVQFGHAALGTDLLLLSILRRQGVPLMILKDLGFRVRVIRHETMHMGSTTCEPPAGVKMVKKMEKKPERSASNLVEVALTRNTLRALHLAGVESRRLKHPFIGSEHVFMGLVREREGIASVILTKMGVKYEEALDALIWLAKIRRA